MKLVTSLAVASIAFLPIAANATVTVSVNSVSGVWTSTSGTTASGIGTNTISWGDGVGGGPQSSYVFDGIAPPTVGPFNAGAIFDLGAFTHNNYPILPPSITGASLAVTVDGIFDDGSGTQAFSLVSLFDFDHNETTNSPSDGTCDFGGTVLCPDIVTPTTHTWGSDTVNIGGVDYLIAVTGFDGIGSSFMTLENQSNMATLQATFTTKASVVPVPAGLPLLVSALGLVGFVARRKRRAA